SSGTWSSTTVSRRRPTRSSRSSAPKWAGCRHPVANLWPTLLRRTAHALISPRIDKLLDHVDSDYASVIVAAKRARQINSYYHNLGEGALAEFPPPMVETRSKNYQTIALEEVAQGKLKYHYR